MHQICYSHLSILLFFSTILGNFNYRSWQAMTRVISHVVISVILLVLLIYN